MKKYISMFDSSNAPYITTDGQNKSLTEIDIMLNTEIKNGNFVGTSYYTVIEPGLTHLDQDETISHKELLKNIQKYGACQFATLPMITFEDNENLANI